MYNVLLTNQKHIFKVNQNLTAGHLLCRIAMIFFFFFFFFFLQSHFTANTKGFKRKGYVSVSSTLSALLNLSSEKSLKS